ncbi:MAG: FkbM family methyltransferase [Desulfobacterales bacterium]|jgi:FkbM family methyltransferase
MFKMHDLYRLAGTVKTIQFDSLPRFAVFCVLTACNTLHRSLFQEKPFLLVINGKRFELRVGKGEYDFLYETNVKRVYEPSDDFVPGPADVAVDVGANFGSASIQWHRKITRGVIYAIEPHPDTFQRLLRHIELNRAEKVVKPFCTALGAKDGMLSLFLSEAGTMAMKTRSATYGGSQMRVPCLTLDSFAETQNVDHIDLIKIDVEGFESDVLRGAAQMLENTRRVVLEYHSPALKERCSNMLSNAGFDLFAEGSLIFARKK